jgi:hypothetical protein
MPYRGAGGGKARAIDLAYFRRVCGPAGVAVKPVMVAWQLTDPTAALNQAADHWRDGADGLTVWDANSAAPKNDLWSVYSRLGHRDELLARAEAGGPPKVTVKLHKLDGVVVDGPWSPNWGY